MDVNTLGSLGEFIGSIAVLVTLMYLAYQTKQNNRAMRQRTHSDILGRRQALFDHLIDPEFVEIWSKGMVGEPMTGIDSQRFTTFTVSFLSHVQDTYMQNKTGLIDDDVWEAEARLCSSIFTQPGFRNWWLHGQQFLTPDFIKTIEEYPTTNLVLYDTEKNQWVRPAGGNFGRNIE